MTSRFRRDAVVAALGMTLLVCGCASHRASSASPTTLPIELSGPIADIDVQAQLVPPIGWRKEPLKITRRSKHQLWLSPSGHTAYGVIYFKLPLPVGYELALWGFLDEMKRTEGSSQLVEKHWDENLHALRFVANGGLHRVEVNFFIDERNGGWTGWAVYAGTQQNQPINFEELTLARLAREHTSVGPKPADRR